MILEIIKKDFFLTLLQAFLDKKQIDITVSEESLLVECIEICKYYLNLDRSTFSSSCTREKFSVDPVHLYKALNLLDTSRMAVDSDHILLENDRSLIKIPLLSTLDHTYEEVGDVHTQFMLRSIYTISILKGLVRYEIEDGTLYIRRLAREVFEEIEIRDVDFVEAGELSFACNNTWSGIVEDISRNIQGAMFYFSDCFLSVQFLFKDNEKVYLEIQIPKSLVEL